MPGTHQSVLLSPNLYSGPLPTLLSNTKTKCEEHKTAPTSPLPHYQHQKNVIVRVTHHHHVQTPILACRPFVINFHDTRATYPTVVHELRLVTDLQLLD